MMEMELPGSNLPVYDGNPANLPGATQFAYFPGGTFSLLEKGTIGMATAIQPLYAGSQISTGNKLATLGVEVSELQLVAAKNGIILQTEHQYWQIISLNEKLKTLDRYIAMVDTLHKEVADAWQAGLITRNDLLKVELKQNELQMNRLKLENGIELARMALCQYMGVNYSSDIVFEGEIPQAQAPGTIYTDHRQALGDRSEYRMLQKSTEAEKYRTKLTRGEYMPQVGVGASALYLDIMNDSGTTYGGVFGTVKVPLSGWWEASHKLKERRLREEQNKNMVNDNTEKLLLQMQQAKNSLDEAYKQVQLGETAVRQAEEKDRKSVV
jgi:outer membrane protein TolC